MKNNSFDLFVRRPTFGARICAFRLLCVATVLLSLFSGLGLAQNAPSASVTGSGTADFIPRWTGTTTLGNSNIFETVGGDVGIATTTPAARLDVKGTGAVRDTLILIPKLTHPTLSVHGTTFAVSNTGNVTFVSGQIFPGTVASVTAGTDLTNTGTAGNPILNLDITKVPQLGTANTFTGNQTVNGTLSATGVVTGGSFDIDDTNGLIKLFAYGNYGGKSAFLGYAGNGTNFLGATAVGYEALFSNTTDGIENTAIGFEALFSNTTGAGNTAVGGEALFSNTTGSNLSCLGFDCTAADHLHNATAIGAHAMVKVSNAVVLGSVAGVNGAKATARVGIGTTSPTNLLTLGQGFGPSISDGWTTYSSRRWKTNIQPLQNALGMVEQLRGVSYDLKDSGKHEIGVIAEEVGAVVPELVSYEENGKDARGVDYGRLTALLIEATKEQQVLIQKQQVQIKAQQKQILVQQKQMTRLASQVIAIRTSLQTGGRTGREARTVKTQANLLPNRGGE